MKKCFWCWYRETQYTFSAPPVCTAYWTAEDWAKVMRPPLIPLRLECAGRYHYASRAFDDKGQRLYQTMR